MKKKLDDVLLLVLTIFLIVIPISYADNSIYFQDSLSLSLELISGFQLQSTGPNPSVNEISADLFLLPQDSFRQTVKIQQTEGSVQDNALHFLWKDNSLEPKSFGYKALVTTKSERRKVTKKINFPLSDAEVASFGEYLKPSETIDSNNPLIIAKASELVEGEDDLFQAVFKLAQWVEENTEYDIRDTVIRESSQKASWVLQNKRGVCDEMTSLLVAMARAVGIPARFVQGISYTEDPDILEQVGKNWLGHGWAEVYFPGTGWISFDVTFNEYGYIDPTHIKLREANDPTESAATFSWKSNNIQLVPKTLDLDVSIINQGNFVPNGVSIEQEILSKEVSFGSYNLIRAIIKNNADYYSATTLRYAAPNEVEVIGKNKQAILLGPNEVREVFWIIKVPENLDPNFWYSFPSVIYTEKNLTTEDKFIAQNERNFYSLEEVKSLVTTDDDRIFSQEVSISCDIPESVKVGDSLDVTCTLKNKGNTNLPEVSLCLDLSCFPVSIFINQEVSKTVSLDTSVEGFHKFLVHAKNHKVDQRESFQYKVLDQPKVNITINSPKEMVYGEYLEIPIEIKKNSFSAPKHLKIVVTGAGIIQQWNIDELQQPQTTIAKVEMPRLSSNTRIMVIAQWEDDNQNIFSTTVENSIKVTPRSFKDRIVMFFNKIVTIFS